MTGFSTVFAVAALVLGRAMSGVWLWNDVVLVHRRSCHATAYVPKSTYQLLHEYWRSPEGQQAYIAWLAHK